jgi:hypothetical protein
MLPLMEIGSSILSGAGGLGGLSGNKNQITPISSSASSSATATQTTGDFVVGGSAGGIPPWAYALGGLALGYLIAKGL